MPTHKSVLSRVYSLALSSFDTFTSQEVCDTTESVYRSIVMKTLLVVCGVVLCVVGVALCKRQTFCGRLVREATETLYHNLPVANDISELVVHRCVTRHGSARVFYSCKEDTIAVLTDTRGNKIKLSSTSIVNLRKRLSLQCDTLTTAPPPVTVPQIEGGIEDLEQLPDVETPSATSPPPTKIERPSPPEELPACPSIAPRSKHSFNTKDGMDPCKKNCSIKINTKGLVQVITRSYYTCCSEEEPRLFGAIPYYYVCQGEPDGIPEEIERPPINRIIPPAVPKVVTNPPPSVRPPAELPACPSVLSSRYSFDTRNGKIPCRFSCSFRTSIYGGAVQVRTRSYYTCCFGVEPRRSGVYYLCP